MDTLEKAAKAAAWFIDKDLEKKYHDELVAQRERQHGDILEQNQRFHAKELRLQEELQEKSLKQQQELESNRAQQYENWQKKSICVQNWLVIATWALVIVSIILKFV
jgi:Na+-translocating ferredoxin:NAD+ oxidoreductase RnfC subunit